MASKKTKFRKTTIELAESLNVEPAEALRIARKFTSCRPEATEAEASSLMLGLLSRCVPNKYNNDPDYDIRCALDAIESVVDDTIDFLKVVKRYRRIRNQRKSWGETISGATHDILRLSDIPDRFCVKEFDASHIRETARKLQQLLHHPDTRPAYCNPPVESLGF